MKIHCVDVDRVWPYKSVRAWLLLFAISGAVAQAGPGPINSDVVFSNGLTVKNTSYTFPNPTGRLPEDFEFYFVCTNDDPGSGITKGQVVGPNAFYDPENGEVYPVWSYFFNGTNSVTVYLSNWPPKAEVDRVQTQPDSLTIASLQYRKWFPSQTPTCLSNFVLVAEWKARGLSAGTEIVYSNAMQNGFNTYTFAYPPGKLPHDFEFYFVCTNDDPPDHYAKGQAASPNSFYDGPGTGSAPIDWCFMYDKNNMVTLLILDGLQEAYVINPSHSDTSRLRALASVDNFMMTARLITGNDGIIVSNGLTRDDGIYTFPNPTGHVPRNFEFYFVCTNDDEDSGFKTGEVISPKCFTRHSVPLNWSYFFDGTNSVIITSPKFELKDEAVAKIGNEQEIQIVNPRVGPDTEQSNPTSLANFVLVARWD